VLPLQCVWKAQIVQTGSKVQIIDTATMNKGKCVAWLQPKDLTRIPSIAAELELPRERRDYGFFRQEVIEDGRGHRVSVSDLSPDEGRGRHHLLASDAQIRSARGAAHLPGSAHADQGRS
jgi:hypothetical protein